MKKLATLAAILFSCASAPTKPEWVRNLPQAPDGSNYNYAIGTAYGSTREEATEKSKEDAYKKVATQRGGTDLRKTAGVKYGVRCEWVVKENAYKYNVYVLLKYQIASTVSGAKDDYNKPDGLECETQIIEYKIDEKDKEIGDKRRQQRQKTEDLEAIAKTFESIGNSKHKNKAWLEGKKLYDEINILQVELQNLGAGEDLASIAKVYGDMRDNCIIHSKTAKLHWNPEQETPYSEIAFSKFSSSVKIEKSPCNGRGISLVYRGTEPSCSVKFGLNTCDYAQSLSVSACDGTEYLQLKSDVMGAHQKPDFALEKLQGNLKSAEFWSQWMQEIKQWSPQCE
ncbi:MAG: hypothetical protein LBH25_09720 [Fibromonadaceae bacterium]|jgi:hypothetical protein|nr:hypothetical protein [Fibromonadaceae bacterium]